MSEYLNIIINQHNDKEKKPYNLLLLADPSKKIIDEYLVNSEIYNAKLNDEIVGVFVLYPLLNNSVEIKNIAVLDKYQGKGIGSLMLENAIQIAKKKKYVSIYIGTANSSIGQLYLYQKKGFDISEIKKDFFIENYSDPIYENGIQAKHMIMLEKVF